MDYMADKLRVMVFETRADLGIQAGEDAAKCIKNMLLEKDELNVMFAAAPSQNETLKTLCKAPDIDWSRVNAYHMDEYVGLDAGHPAGFRNYLKRTVFCKLSLKSLNLINGNAGNPQKEAERYSNLLRHHPADICLLGVGENGHLAFNDPPEVDFHDAEMARVVRLDKRCRQQQVNDGCFDRLEEVPTHAVTVTIPGLMAARYLFCSVPGSSKAEAVRIMLNGTVAPGCPASILTTHVNSILYLDRESAKYLL